MTKRLPPDQISKSARSYGQKDSEQIEEVHDWFGKPGNTRCLLIYDNVDREITPSTHDSDAYDIDEYLPQVDQGSVIITSRQFELRDRGEEMQVPVMTDEEALQVLERKMNRFIRGISGCPLADSL